MFQSQRLPRTWPVDSQSCEAILRSFPFCTVSLDADDQVDFADRLGGRRKHRADHVHLVGFLVGGSHLARMLAAIRFALLAKFCVYRICPGDRHCGNQIWIVFRRSRVDDLDYELVCQQGFCAPAVCDAADSCIDSSQALPVMTVCDRV